MRARSKTVACVALIALVAPGVARASSSASLGDGSAIDQYAETLPGASGKVRPGAGKKTTIPLSTKSATSLNQLDSSSRKVLTNMATKSQFGNPTASIGVVKTPPAGSFQSSLGRSLLARLASPGTGSENRLVVLLIAIVTITVALGITAARRQRELNRR